MEDVEILIFSQRFGCHTIGSLCVGGDGGGGSVHGGAAGGGVHVLVGVLMS